MHFDTALSTRVLVGECLPHTGSHSELSNGSIKAKMSGKDARMFCRRAVSQQGRVFSNQYSQVERRGLQQRHIVDREL